MAEGASGIVNPPLVLRPAVRGEAAAITALVLFASRGARTSVAFAGKPGAAERETTPDGKLVPEAAPAVTGLRIAGWRDGSEVELAGDGGQFVAVVRGADSPHGAGA